MANANYISVDDLKTIYAPGLDYSGLGDTTLSGMIAVGSRWVDSYTGAPKGWDFEAVTDTYESNINANTDADGNLHIAVRKRPIQTVDDITDISIKLGGYSTSLTLTSNGTSVLHAPDPGFEIVYPNTWLVSTGTLLTNQRLYNLRSYKYFVDVTYSAGYQDIPEEIKMATALIVQDIISKRYNPTAATSFRQGSMSASYGSKESPLIASAKQYLEDYVRVW